VIPSFRSAFLVLAIAALSALAAPPAGAQTQENYLFTVSLLGGLGGSIDAEPDAGLDQRSLVASFAFVTEPRLHTVVKLGQLTIDDEPLGTIADAEVEYVTVGGDYRVLRGFYDSGLFMGLGAYRLSGERGGAEEEDTAIGAHLGVSGEIRTTSWLGLVLELTGHWVDFDEQQIFATGNVGVAIHF
jgi:hypothetical protein